MIVPNLKVSEEASRNRPDSLTRWLVGRLSDVFRYPFNQFDHLRFAHNDGFVLVRFGFVLIFCFSLILILINSINS